MYRSTVFHQVMLAEYEKKIHELDLENNVLTEELFSNEYMSILKKYYGDSVTYDKEAGLGWARVPHFYDSFYLYQYATGFMIAARFVKDILDNKENSIDTYLKVLKAGGRAYPLDILKDSGIDIVNDDTIDKALLLFKETIEEFKRSFKD